MEVSSELRVDAESVPSVLFTKRAQPVDPHCVADEEFPPDLSVAYDWMLQPARRRPEGRTVRLVAVTLAALLIAVSFYLVHSLPRSFPSVWASPSSSSR